MSEQRHVAQREGGAARLPGPAGWRSWTEFRALRRNPAHYFADLQRRFGDVAMTRVGPRRICLVSDPELVHQVLIGQQRNVRKTRALRRAALLLGDGLLTSEHDLWLRQRRLMQPAFHRERIAGYAATMVQFAEHTADGWRDGAELDAHQAMMRLTLAIAARTLFGADVDDEADEIGAALDVTMSMFPRLTMPLSELLDGLPLPANRRFAAARGRLDATVHRMIRARRAAAATPDAVGDDLLGMLLAARDDDAEAAAADDVDAGEGAPCGMTDTQVRDEAITLFLAGHETTANALAWTWHLLARHPEAAAALHTELDTVLGARAPTAADLPRLSFTRAVVAEAMRLYPPAWVVGRETIEPFVLGGYVVPARTMLFMSQWVIQRDARWFPEPEAFRPARWTPEMERALPRFAYFPFGGGPRRCIGESFAWMEAVLVLATIARRWHVEPAPGAGDVAVRPLITLRPAGPIRVRVVRRPA